MTLDKLRLFAIDVAADWLVSLGLEAEDCPPPSTSSDIVDQLEDGRHIQTTSSDAKVESSNTQPEGSFYRFHGLHILDGESKLVTYNPSLPAEMGSLLDRSSTMVPIDSNPDSHNVGIDLEAAVAVVPGTTLNTPVSVALWAERFFDEYLDHAHDIANGWKSSGTTNKDALRKYVLLKHAQGHAYETDEDLAAFYPKGATGNKIEPTLPESTDGKLPVGPRHMWKYPKGSKGLKSRYMEAKKIAGDEWGQDAYLPNKYGKCPSKPWDVNQDLDMGRMRFFVPRPSKLQTVVTDTQDMTSSLFPPLGTIAQDEEGLSSQQETPPSPCRQLDTIGEEEEEEEGLSNKQEKPSWPCHQLDDIGEEEEEEVGLSHEQEKPSWSCNPLDAIGEEEEDGSETTEATTDMLDAVEEYMGLDDSDVLDGQSLPDLSTGESLESSRSNTPEDSDSSSYLSLSPGSDDHFEGTQDGSDSEMESPIHSQSPFKRPSAPTPSRGMNYWTMKQEDLDDSSDEPDSPAPISRGHGRHLVRDMFSRISSPERKIGEVEEETSLRATMVRNTTRRSRSSRQYAKEPITFGLRSLKKDTTTEGEEEGLKDDEGTETLSFDQCPPAPLLQVGDPVTLPHPDVTNNGLGSFLFGPGFAIVLGWILFQGMVSWPVWLWVVIMAMGRNYGS
jgi:hypothetical protein